MTGAVFLVFSLTFMKKAVLLPSALVALILAVRAQYEAPLGAMSVGVVPGGSSWGPSAPCAPCWHCPGLTQLTCNHRLVHISYEACWHESPCPTPICPSFCQSVETTSITEPRRKGRYTYIYNSLAAPIFSVASRPRGPILKRPVRGQRLPTKSKPRFCSTRATQHP